jgi:hypothetical protein
MNKLKLLNIKKLLNELDYLEKNYSYIQEIINEADNGFMKEVDDTISKYPDIKEKYNKIINESLENAINITKNETIYSEHDGIILNKEIKNEISKDTKQIYREIVKLTHPDKINNINMNELYIEATNLYNNNDKLGLYKICNKLNIDVYLLDTDEDLIKGKIKDVYSKINFIESTFTWKWFNEESKENKDEIIKHFIKVKFK